MSNSEDKWYTSEDNTEQIDWMCEQIKSLTERMDITIRRLDELFPHRLDHHLRLLKLEEAHERME
jgi:ribosomal protein S10